MSVHSSASSEQLFSKNVLDIIVTVFLTFPLCRRPFGVEKEFFIQLFFEIDNQTTEVPDSEKLLQKMFREQKISFTEVTLTKRLHNTNQNVQLFYVRVCRFLPSCCCKCLALGKNTKYSTESFQQSLSMSNQCLISVCPLLYFVGYSLQWVPN